MFFKEEIQLQTSISPAAVSYTHLDVYKRQDHSYQGSSNCITLLKVVQGLLKVLPVVRKTSNTTMRTDHKYKNSNFIDKLLETN